MLTVQRAAHHLPQSSVQLDPSNQDTTSIIDAWMPGYSTKGLVSGADTAVGIEFNRIVTPRGPGLNVRSNGLRYPGNTLDGQSVAWLVLAYRDGSGDTNCSIAKKDVSVIPAQEWDGNVRTIVWGPQNAAAVAYGTTDKFRNKLTAFCGVFGPNEQAAFYDTQPTFDLSGAGSGSSAVIRTTGNQFTIGAADNGGEVAYPWTTVLVVLWQGARLPTVARMRAYAQNPALLFKQRALPVFPQVPPRVAAALAASATASTSSSCSLTTSIRLSTTGVAPASAGVTLASGIRLGAAGQAPTSSSVTLSTAIALTATAQSQASASVTLANTGTGLATMARAETSSMVALATGIGLAAGGAARTSASVSLSTGICLSSGAAAVVAAYSTLSTGIALRSVGASSTSSSCILVGTVAPVPVFDITKISPERLVRFEGSGSRIVTFSGSGPRMRINEMRLKMPTLIDEKWMVDRDPDEESWYGAEITQELIDRSTTAKSVELVLVGVTQLAAPTIQVAPIDNVSRTFVGAFLGGIDGPVPEGCKWVARVRCANGERFDKTTHFNEVDP